jgi:hypothetical protein
VGPVTAPENQAEPVVWISAEPSMGTAWSGCVGNGVKLAVIGRPKCRRPIGTDGHPRERQVTMRVATGTRVGIGTVTASPGGNTCQTVTLMTLTCTVTGLTDGTSYQFSVVATNANGDSRASRPSLPVTPLLIGAASFVAWGTAASVWEHHHAGPQFVNSPAPRTFVAVSNGGSHSLALDDRGGVWARGKNGSGELGTGTASGVDGAVQPDWTSVTILPSGTRLTAVSASTSFSGAGPEFSVALDADGSLWTWGADGYGWPVTVTAVPTIRPPRLPLGTFSSRRRSRRSPPEVTMRWHSIATARVGMGPERPRADRLRDELRFDQPGRADEGSGSRVPSTGERRLRVHGGSRRTRVGFWIRSIVLRSIAVGNDHC